MNYFVSKWGIVGDFCTFVSELTHIRYAHMRFTGNIDAKTDDKGRVFLPAAFRKLLQREEVDSLILRKDIFQHCLVLYPEEVWNSLVDTIKQQTNPFDKKGREAMRGFVAGAERISLDGSGRILIPRRYLEYANIGNDVRFIGMDDTIEVWNRQQADDILDDPETLAENLEQIMNRNNHES